MAKIHWKGSALLAPVPPALISCGDMQNANLLTIGWAGIINTQPPKTYISVREERHSFSIIKEKKEFIIHLPTQELVRAIDWCGVKSGRDYDKFKEMHLTPEPAFAVSCPQVAECPVSLECKVFDIVPLGTHHMFLADIVGVNVDEKLLDKNGKLHLERANLIAYAHGDYYTLGKQLGDFGFSVRKKNTPPKKRAPKKP